MPCYSEPFQSTIQSSSSRSSLYNDRAERTNFSYQMFERLQVDGPAYSGVLAAQDGRAALRWSDRKAGRRKPRFSSCPAAISRDRRQQLARSASDAR